MIRKVKQRKPEVLQVWQARDGKENGGTGRMRRRSTCLSVETISLDVMLRLAPMNVGTRTFAASVWPAQKTHVSTRTWLDEGEGVLPTTDVSSLSARFFIASEPRNMARRGEACGTVE